MVGDQWASVMRAVNRRPAQCLISQNGEQSLSKITWKDFVRTPLARFCQFDGIRSPVCTETGSITCKHVHMALEAVKIMCMFSFSNRTIHMEHLLGCPSPRIRLKAVVYQINACSIRDLNRLSSYSTTG